MSFRPAESYLRKNNYNPRSGIITVLPSSLQQLHLLDFSTLTDAQLLLLEELVLRRFSPEADCDDFQQLLAMIDSACQQRGLTQKRSSGASGAPRKVA
ncbi:MAG: hypothetical protein MI864_13715 [Pseudomonadales bacterium]|uniref:Uncharacterized protein n=1 Tax=Oleiphilus messinensis TaxID=141451 RepID=A0A1Y0I9C9_9GAMM|nr:hypothetical protein [Oleiphilus messinensis]ARU57127.1 hypothetical protein OLMES_3084 [Oleiphilus messinensis]MCG8611583.1 hypothetical protein [Pseudomonadales bacterium]